MVINFMQLPWVGMWIKFSKFFCIKKLKARCIGKKRVLFKDKYFAGKESSYKDIKKRLLAE